jgi:hypothetical protein
VRIVRIEGVSIAAAGAGVIPRHGPNVGRRGMVEFVEYIARPAVRLRPGLRSRKGPEFLSTATAAVQMLIMLWMAMP